MRRNNKMAIQSKGLKMDLVHGSKTKAVESKGLPSRKRRFKLNLFKLKGCQRAS